MRLGDACAFGQVLNVCKRLLWRQWKPLDMVWFTLAFGYVFFGVLFFLGSATGHTLAPTEGTLRASEFRVDAFARRLISAFACTATAISSYYTLGSFVYTKGPKKQPLLSAFLFYILMTATFVLDASDSIFRPYGIEIQNYYIHITSMFMMYSAFGTLIVLRHGTVVANEELGSSTLYGFFLWSLALPAPMAFLSLNRRDWSFGVAAAVAASSLLGYTWTYLIAAKRMQALLNLHWTIIANGLLLVVSWVFTYVLHFGMVTGSGYSIVNARAIYIFTLVFQSTQVGLIVFQSIDSYEESARFKSERDAAQAELLVRSEQQRQAKAAEDARQKFLRYIFHEIRVPFNSIDMGLGLLREDIKASQTTQKHTTTAISSVIDDSAPSTARDGADGATPRMKNSRTVAISEAGRSRRASLVWLPADAVETLDTISKASLSMKVIINDTLDWTKLQSGSFKIRPSPSDIRKDLRNTLEGLLSFAQHNNVQVVHEMDESMPDCLLVDSVRLHQVVANYLSNGIKFVPTDGTGSVRLRVYCIRGEAQGHSKLPARPSSVTVLAQDGLRGTSTAQVLPPLDLSDIWWKEATPASGALVEASKPSHSGAAKALTALGAMPPAVGSALTTVVVAEDVLKPVAGATAAFNIGTDLRFVEPTDSTLHRLAEEGYSIVSTPSGPETATIILSVRDNGQGIAGEEASLLFDAFRQLDAGMQYKGKSTGLGLAICHEIVSMHGGRVGVRSSGQPGDGAEFFAALKLPVLVRAPTHGTERTRITSTAHAWSHISVHGKQEAATGTGKDVGAPASSLHAPAHLPPVHMTHATTGGGRLVPDGERTGSGSSSSSSCLATHACDAVAAGANTAENARHSSTHSVGDPAVLSPASCIPGQIVAEGVEACHHSAPAGSAGEGQHRTSGLAVTGSALPLPRSVSRPSLAAGTLSGPGPSLDPILAASGSTSSTHDGAGVHTGQTTTGTGAGTERPTLRVLVVDDVTDNRKLLKKALGRRLAPSAVQNTVGFRSCSWLSVECDEAEDGHIAVEMVAKNGVGYYNVITMDAEMPTMSGFVATERIRASGYAGLLFGCTGNALESDQALFAEKGTDAVYVKPIDISALCADIRERLRNTPRA